MPNSRQDYRFPRLGVGFKGEFNAEGPTDERYQVGFLRACRNYHLMGLGKLLKRKGHKPTIAAQINASAAVQGVAMWTNGTTHYLVGVSNGKIKYLNGSSYTDITGTLTPGTGNGYHARFTRFTQAGVVYLVGTGPNNTALWKWAGSGNANTLYTGAALGSILGPTYAKDIAEFRGRLFAIGTETDPAIVEYSNDSRLDSWDEGQYFYCTRRSPGMGLMRHNEGVLLVFHRDEIHRIEFDYQANEQFTRQLVDGSTGAASTYSICSSKGVTYFASDDGPYRIRNPYKPAEFIGGPIKEFWGSLNPERLSSIVAFERGTPYDEVVFLVSTGTNTQNDAALVYNTVLDAWTIFDSTAGYLQLNTGCDFITTGGRHVTMCGRYDGKISECWGDDDYYDTGNMDDDTTGAAVSTLFQTGDLDFGYRGLKRLREIWLDLLLSNEVTFGMQITTTGGTVESTTPTSTIGNPAARLSIDFTFDTSAFGAGTSVQAKIKKNIKARMFQFSLSENSDGPPHTLNSLVFLYMMRGMNFKAIV